MGRSYSFPPDPERIFESLSALYKNHEAEIERLAKSVIARIIWPAQLLLLMLCCLLTYCFYVGVILAVCYGVAYAIGLDVPSGGLFHAIWSYYQAPTPNAIINVFGMFIVALWIFVVRMNFRVTYGVVEMVLGAAIVCSVGLPESFDQKTLLILAGGLYVMIRGLDNVEKGLPPDNYLANWMKHYPTYIRYRIISDFLRKKDTPSSLRDIFSFREVRKTHDQLARDFDPSSWHSVDGKNPYEQPPDGVDQGHNPNFCEAESNKGRVDT